MSDRSYLENKFLLVSELRKREFVKTFRTKEAAPIYDKLFDYKGRHVVLAGGKGCGKTYTITRLIVKRLIEDTGMDALAFRYVKDTLKASVRQSFITALSDAGVLHYWDVRPSALNITNPSTGQTIHFKGFDDWQKAAGLEPSTGKYFGAIWVEELFEFTNERDLDKALFSFRSTPPEGGYRQFYFTMNTWDSAHFAKKKYFDTERDDTLSLQIGYLDNSDPVTGDLYLDADTVKAYEVYKDTDPDYYNVLALGHWGNSRDTLFGAKTRRQDTTGLVLTDKSTYYGLDFGYDHYTVISHVEVGTYIAKERTLKVLIIKNLEAYNRMLQSDIIPIQSVVNTSDYVVADNADPAAIREWANNGYNIDSAKKRVKVKGVARNQAGTYLKTYVDFLRSFDTIIVDNKCHDIAYNDFSTVSYKSNKTTGALMFEVNKLICPDGDYDAFDSVKYALEVLYRSNNSAVFSRDNAAGEAANKPVHNTFIKGRRNKNI